MNTFVTHAVENQVPPLAPYNAWTTDHALQEAVKREGGAWAEAQLKAYGAVDGSELMDLGFAANENKPKLKLFDRYGHRLDEVEFHPAYHRVMIESVAGHPVATASSLAGFGAEHAARMSELSKLGRALGGEENRARFQRVR